MQLIRIIVHDDDVMAFSGQLPHQQETDLAVSDNNDFHKISSSHLH